MAQLGDMAQTGDDPLRRFEKIDVTPASTRGERTPGRGLPNETSAADTVLRKRTHQRPTNQGQMLEIGLEPLEVGATLLHHYVCISIMYSSHRKNGRVELVPTTRSTLDHMD